MDIPPVPPEAFASGLKINEITMNAGYVVSAAVLAENARLTDLIATLEAALAAFTDPGYGEQGDEPPAKTIPARALQFTNQRIGLFTPVNT